MLSNSTKSVYLIFAQDIRRFQSGISPLTVLPWIAVPSRKEIENSTFKSFQVRGGQSILDMHNKYRSGRTSSICWYYLPLSKSYCMLYAHICHPFELHPASACWDTWGYPELEALLPLSCDEALLEKSFRPGDVSVFCNINACSLKSQRVFRNWPHMQVLFKFAVVFEEDWLPRNSVKRPKATHH